MLYLDLYRVLTYLILGLCCGSFLNVVVYRLPLIIYANPESLQDYSLSWPPSSCTHCLTKIKPYHLIPVFSWLQLKGKCHSCQTKISARYPITEVITALFFCYLSVLYSDNVVAILLCFLTATLIALTQIDYDQMLLPDALTLPLVWVAFISELISDRTTLHDGVIGAIAGYLVMCAIYHFSLLITKKESLGLGDLKLYAALGAWAGWQMLPLILFMSTILTFMIFLYFSLHDKQKSTLPFGPALALSGWLVIVHPELATSASLMIFSF